MMISVETKAVLEKYIISIHDKNFLKYKTGIRKYHSHLIMVLYRKLTSNILMVKD